MKCMPGCPCPYYRACRTINACLMTHSAVHLFTAGSGGHLVSAGCIALQEGAEAVGGGQSALQLQHLSRHGCLLLLQPPIVLLQLPCTHATPSAAACSPAMHEVQQHILWDSCMVNMGEGMQACSSLQCAIVMVVQSCHSCDKYFI